MALTPLNEQDDLGPVKTYTYFHIRLFSKFFFYLFEIDLLSDMQVDCVRDSQAGFDISPGVLTMIIYFRVVKDFVRGL